MKIINKSCSFLIYCFLTIFLFIYPSPVYAITLSVEETDYLNKKGTIVFVSQTRYPPFEFVDTNKQHDGMMIDIIRWMALEIGFKPVFTDMTFQQAQEAVLSGKADILTSLFHSKKREEKFEFTDTLFNVPASIFVKAERTDIKSLKDLNNKTIAIQKGDYAKEYLESQRIRFKTFDTKDFGEATEMVISGKADAVIGDEQIVLYHIFSNRLTDRIKKVGEPLYTGKNCMASKKGNSILIGILKKGIDNAGKSGLLNKIYKKWLGTIYSQDKSFLQRYLWPFIFVVGGILLLLLAIWIWNVRLRLLLLEKIEVINRTDVALRESEVRFRELSDFLPQIVYETDSYGNLKYANRIAFDLFGYTKEEFEHGLNVMQMITPDSRELATEAFRKILEGIVPPPAAEYLALRKDGSTFPVLIYASPVIVDKKIKGLRGIIIDITERNRAEEALRESEERYRIAIEAANDGVTIVQNDSHVYVNQKFLEIFGYDTPEEVLGKPRSFIVHPDYQELVTGYARAREKGEYAPNRYEFKGIRQDGVIVDIEVSANKIKYKGAIATLVYMRDITERKVAEEALRESEARLDTIIQGSPMPQFVIDKNHKVIHWNEALEKYSGINAEEIIGTTRHWMAFYPEERPCLADLLVDDEIDKIREWYKGKYSKSNLIEGGYEATDFFQSMGVSGSWLYFTAVPIRDVDGFIVGAIETLEDITERKRAEERALLSQEEWERTFNTVPDLICILDTQYRLLGVNASMAKRLGASSKEMDGLICYQVVHGTQRPPDFCPNRQLLQDWQEHMAEIHEDRLGGDFLITCTPLHDREGKLIGSIHVARDITERKQAEETLKHSEGKVRAILHAIPDLLFVNNREGTYLDFYAPDTSLLYLSPETIIGKSIRDVFPKTKADFFLEMFGLCLTTGEVQTAEYELVIRNNPMIFEARIVPLDDDSVMTLVRDRTHEKRAEEALLFEKERSLTLLENAPFGIVLILKNGTISYINRRFTDIFGYELEDIPDGKTWFRKAYPDAEYRHEVISAWKGDLEKSGVGEQRPRVFIVVCKDGSKKTINFVPVMLSSRDQVMSCEDITARLHAEEEKRKLEERLTRAEKMEALGTLAGGVAHDLNNVLGVLIGYAELLIDEKDEANRKDFLANIIDGGRKTAAMVEDMLTMTRRGVASRDVLNLNSLIAEYENSLAIKSLLNNHASVEMKVDLALDLLNISGSRVHLEKMLFNLILNAFEAMPKGGILSICTNNQYLEKPIVGYDEVKQGEYVVLSVSDTGIGISATDIKRIFEPFYTKKIMGRSGTGLGLALVWGTVKDHNGYINVKSEEGKGSTFTLYFPVSREEITADSISVSIAEYMGKGESILVVDDVKGQRELAAQMLKKLNYQVTVVASGEEAVENIKKQPADLMLLDMIMDPGMDGLDTYKKILEIRPKQKAIIVSGFSETDRVDEAQAAGAGAYVKKPYVIEKLGLAVRNELDRSA